MFGKDKQLVFLTRSFKIPFINITDQFKRGSVTHDYLVFFFDFLTLDKVWPVSDIWGTKLGILHNFSI